MSGSTEVVLLSVFPASDVALLGGRQAVMSFHDDFLRCFFSAPSRGPVRHAQRTLTQVAVRGESNDSLLRELQPGAK